MTEMTYYKCDCCVGGYSHQDSGVLRYRHQRSDQGFHSTAATVRRRSQQVSDVHLHAITTRL